MAARNRVEYKDFERVVNEFVGAGTPLNRITLKMLIDRLGGSNSTHIAYRERYIREHQQPALQPQLPGTISAAILAFGDQRAETVRAELAAEFAQERESTQGLMAELKQVEQDLAVANARIQDLATKNATLEGQASQQAAELAELKQNHAQLTERATTLERDLHVAQAEVQGSNGRVEEIRAAADRQVQRLREELQQAREEARASQLRAAEAEKAQVAADARLEGERHNCQSLQARVSELQETVARLEGDALRAVAADAAAAGLRDNVKVLSETLAILKGLVGPPADATVTSAGAVPG